jgi:hypothetical protein
MGELREDDADDETGQEESGNAGWHDYGPLGGELPEEYARKKEKAFRHLKDEGRI